MTKRDELVEKARVAWHANVENDFGNVLEVMAAFAREHAAAEVKRTGEEIASILDEQRSMEREGQPFESRTSGIRAALAMAAEVARDVAAGTYPAARPDKAPPLSPPPSATDEERAAIELARAREEREKLLDEMEQREVQMGNEIARLRAPAASPRPSDDKGDAGEAELANRPLASEVRGPQGGSRLERVPSGSPHDSAVQGAGPNAAEAVREPSPASPPRPDGEVLFGGRFIRRPAAPVPSEAEVKRIFASVHAHVDEHAPAAKPPIGQRYVTAERRAMELAAESPAAPASPAEGDVFEAVANEWLDIPVRGNDNALAALLRSRFGPYVALYERLCDFGSTPVNVKYEIGRTDEALAAAGGRGTP